MDKQVMTNRGYGADVESLSRIAANVVSNITAIGLRTSDRVEDGEGEREAGNEGNKARYAALLKNRLFGGLCHDYFSRWPINTSLSGNAAREKK